jgi:isopenicillin-N epimerase
MIDLGIPARALFFLEPGVSFLNHGSFGAVPRVVADAADAWRHRMEANPDHFMREVLPAELRLAAGRLAHSLHAREQDVVFVENATAGINTVLRSLDFRPGDEILTSSHCYGAVRQAIRHLCERSGCRHVEGALEMPVRSEQDLLASLVERLGERTRLLIVDHIAAPTGLVFPVAGIAAAARRRGVKVLVDGAHAPGQIELDLPSLGADWYVGNCHKWLFTPRGCGFLWARGDAQAGLHPLAVSHAYGEGFTAEFDWTGTRDFSAWLSVGAALDFAAAIGAGRIREYNHGLVTRAATRIAAAWRRELDGPAALHAAMVAVRLPPRLEALGPATAETAKRLMSVLFAEHRVRVAVNAVSGALWARLSAQIYNTAEDYEPLARLA